MKTTVLRDEFVTLLVNDVNANWSAVGAEALFYHLEELEEDIGEELELDVIGLRCQFAELHAHEFFKESKEQRDEMFIAQLSNGKFLCDMEAEV
jgi:hypothetical protein